MDIYESMDQRIAEAKARLESTQAAVASARAELSAASVTAKSKDRSVEVTVGPQGGLQHVKFLGEQYQTMEATKLASSIVEAANKARAAMARRVMDAFSGITPSNEDLPDLRGYRPDWEEIFGSTLAAGRRARKGGAARSRGGQSSAELHDEIVEDGNDD